MAAPMKSVVFQSCKLFQVRGMVQTLVFVRSLLGKKSHLCRIIQRNREYQVCNIHTTAKFQDLMEFFDKKENWQAGQIKVGRPWAKDELRLKSNTDLHKLWYVLLKERNMIMTMEEAYKQECELMPNPERLEKVEESMENLLEVVAERDRAVNLLETGRTGEPEPYTDRNILGIPYIRTPKEHYIPPHVNSTITKKVRLAGRWQERWLARLGEKRKNHDFWRKQMEEKRMQELKEIFPDAEIN